MLISLSDEERHNWYKLMFSEDPECHILATEIFNSFENSNLVIVQLGTVGIQIDYIRVINMDNYLIEISSEENWSIEDVKHTCDKISNNELNSIVHMLISPDKEISNLGYELFMSYKNG